VVEIRPESIHDADAVAAVNEAAFGRPDEARLVARLRGRARPYLGLVAVEDGAVVGHILFTPVPLQCDQGRHIVMALAPMSVLPAHQRRGIGTALVHAGLEACRAAGHEIVMVLGHPAFYPRFGFVRAHPLGLTSEPPFPDESFMLAELTPGALRGRRGVIRYDDFG